MIRISINELDVVGLFSFRAQFINKAIYRIKGFFALLATRQAFCFLSVFFLCSSAYAQNINVSAQVDSNVVSLGMPFPLLVTVSGSQNVEPVQLGTLDGFDVQYRGPSKRVSIINGQYSTSTSFEYSLLPTKVGKFEIPSLDVKVDNQIFKTTAIPIEVIDQTSAPTSQGQQPTSSNLSDKIFLEMQVPKTDLIMGEKVPVKIFLFIAGVSISDVQYPQLETTGFKLLEYNRPSQYQQSINGIQYNIVEFQTALYPTRTGELTLGPVTLDCNLIVPSSRQNRFGSAFDDDFFNVFFDRQERRSITIKSKELKLSVKDLPQEERPESFSGGVGNFNFEATVSPVDVNVGDPITLKMTLQGDGNLSAVNFPTLKSDENLKVYDPTIKEEGGVKKLEQVIIPRHKDLREIPAFEFSYFNVDLNKYLKIVKGPFTINLTENVDAKNPPVITGLDKQDATPLPVQDSLGEDIVFIKDSIGRLNMQGNYFYYQIWFYVGLGFMITGWVGFMLYYQLTQRLKADHQYHHRTRAPKYAKAGLESAQQLLTEHKPQEFYDVIFKTWQNYVSHRFIIPVGEISLDRIRPLITGEKSNEMIDLIKLILSECEAVRYASTTMTKDQMVLTLERLKTVIDYCEKNGKKSDLLNKKFHKVAITLMAFLIIWLSAVSGFAQLSEPLVNIKFTQANEAYRSEKYEEAIFHYEEILQGRWESAAVYFNLGNSYFKNKQLGQAILNYSRALQLSPRDSDVNFNYRYALNKVKQIESTQQKSWMDRLIDEYLRFYSMGEMIVILLILGGLIAGWMIFNLYVPQMKSVTPMVLIGVSLLLSFHCVGLFLKWSQSKNLAVMIQDTSAKFEPRPLATTHFELFEGNSIRIVDKEDEWIKIKRFDGKLGWVESKAVGKI